MCPTAMKHAEDVHNPQVKSVNLKTRLALTLASSAHRPQILVIPTQLTLAARIL